MHATMDANENEMELMVITFKTLVKDSLTKQYEGPIIKGMKKISRKMNRKGKRIPSKRFATRLHRAITQRILNVQ